ncbi:MAG: CotH kinase family protein, partial [Bacteroidales bacterium]|nr:CotH kinase family protein [Bacteroidales bacterium]
MSYSGDIVINEFMSSNTTSLKDEDGDYSDWIELYNKSDKPINLKDYSISDNIKEARKWLFPEITIAPRGFLIIFASDKDRKNGSFLHCNFKLSSAGEALVLTDASNNISDQINPVKLSSDISYGKMPDGGTDMMEFFYPTPGVSNNNSSSSNISFSHNSGYYDKSFVFIITSKDTVYYTLNGSEPNKSSLLYYKPILIDNISSKPNSLSTIQTGYNEYIAPEQLVFKATVIRARAYKNGQPSSSIFTKTFLIDNNIKNLFANQIISLVTDSLNFFGSDTGIYVPGKLFNPNSPKGSGNYLMTGPEWERPLHIEFFDKDGVSILSQNAGTRIHGASVRKFHQKSLRLYAREEYGNKYFNYKLFPQGEENQYKRLIVRSAMCDWSKTIFKDMMGQNLVKDLNIDIQNSYPVNVLINGEYWGLHILAERIDKYYLSSRYRIDPDSLDLLENGSANIVEGTNKDYLGMITYLKNNDISKTSNYNHIKSLMDIDNYIDYQITEIYLNNYDWPENNVKFWKTHKTGSKWRWILYDLDYAFGQYGVDYNMIEHSTKEGVTGWPNSDESTFLFRTLLKNEDFKNQFIGRFDVLMNSVFSASNIVSLINKYKTMIEPDVPAQINRWHYP